MERFIPMRLALQGGRHDLRGMLRACMYMLMGAGLHALQAQSPCAFDLGPDAVLCPGQELVLQAPPGADSYLWNTGPTGASLTVDAPGTYWVTVVQAAGLAVDLVVNGDFSAGATDFSSAYEHSTTIGPYGLLSDEAQYVVATDPQDAHIDFASCGDHTTGTGSMLVVNGAATPDVSIWCQQVAVQPNTVYTLSAWVLTAFAANPATLGFTINGVAVGDPLAAPATTCTWEDFSATWNSATATTAELCIVNLNTEVFGNDFALDDISFTGGASPCTFTDTVVVSPFTGTLDLGADRALCPGDSLELTAAGAPSVSWSTGAEGPTLQVHAPGTYWAVLQETGCFTSDTVVVQALPVPVVELGDTLWWCPGSTVELDAGTAGDTYVWSTGSTASRVLVSTPGRYSVRVTASGCTGADTVVVAEPPVLPPAPVTAALPWCPGDEVVLHAPAAAAYLWGTGATGGSVVVNGPGAYTVTLTNGCTARTDTLHVVRGACDTYLYVPNAFTPDSDGRNDTFFPVFSGPVGPFALDIFNRWGEHLYHMEDTRNAWDGTYRGSPVPDGLYVWKLEYYDTSGDRREQQDRFGHVTLLR